VAGWAAASGFFFNKCIDILLDSEHFYILHEKSGEGSFNLNVIV